MEIKHSPTIVYRIYDYLKENCVGEESAISGRDLARHFKISERGLRDYIAIIRKSSELRKVIGSSTRGYYVCANKEEAQRANQTFWSTAYSYLKVAKAQEKKAGLDGQYLLALGDYYKEFYEAFGGVD